MASRDRDRIASCIVTRRQVQRDPVDGLDDEYIALVTPHITVKKSPRVDGW